jgi:hypothetical protein
MSLVTCETSAAIALHLRDADGWPVNLEGHRHPRPSALCGVAISWDTRSPIMTATCNACIQAAKTWKTP